MLPLSNPWAVRDGAARGEQRPNNAERGVNQMPLTIIPPSRYVISGGESEGSGEVSRCEGESGRGLGVGSARSLPAAAAERGENSGGSAGKCAKLSGFRAPTTNDEAGREPPALPLTSTLRAPLFVPSRRSSRLTISVRLSAWLPTTIHAARVSTLVHAGCRYGTAEGDEAIACRW